MARNGANDDSRPVLRIGHSPDPDDAFMWWPLVEIDGRPSRMDTGRFRFRAVLDDIESLNQRSLAADLEITAISCAQYPHVKDRYALTSCGSSMGDHYGPKLVSRRPMPLDDLRRPDVIVAVPGVRTSAFAAASLLLGPGSFRHAVTPFDQIIRRVSDGEFAAGLIIHEGQLTFAQSGLHLVEDLGAWWSRTRGTLLPLGANVIRRDLETAHGEGTLREVTATLKRSVEFALAHREEAVDYALGYARDMGADLADRFIGLYVNRWSLDFGPQGRQAVQTFLEEAWRTGITPDPHPIDPISPE